MKHILLLLLVCGAGFSALGAGRSGQPKPMPAPDGERFLFIVDISSSMESLQEANEATLYDLIGSGVSRQMRPGDTYGIWTFNRETYAGKFPMQIWDSRNASQLGTVAAAYLSQQTYEQSSDVKRMVATLNALIHSVSNLNVFIISKGDSPLSGTPLDKELNAEYKAKRKPRSKAEKPFVTALIVRDGWIINGFVAIAGEPIELPQRRPPVVAGKKAVAPPKPPAKSEVTAPAPASANTAPTVAEAQKPPPTPAVVVADASVAPNPETPAPAAPRPKLIQIITRSNAVVADPIAGMTAVAVAPVATPNSLASSDVPVPSSISTNVLMTAGPAETEPAAEPATAGSILGTIPPGALPVAARELHAEEPKESAAPSPSAIQAVGLRAAHQGLPGAVMLGYGIVLMAAALFLLVVVFRWNRPASQGSLITQSMDRQ